MTGSAPAAGADGDRASLRLRDACVDDTATIAALHARSWREVYRGLLSAPYLETSRLDDDRRALWSDRLHAPRSDQRVMIAELAGETVGFACAFLDGPRAGWGAFVDNLHVVQRVRGCGVGAALMAAIGGACDDARPDTGLYLSVVTDNRQARRFYAALGGREVEGDHWHAPDESVVPMLWISFPSAAAVADASRARSARSRDASRGDLELSAESGR